MGLGVAVAGPHTEFSTPVGLNTSGADDLPGLLSGSSERLNGGLGLRVGYVGVHVGDNGVVPLQLPLTVVQYSTGPRIQLESGGRQALVDHLAEQDVAVGDEVLVRVYPTFPTVYVDNFSLARSGTFTKRMLNHLTFWGDHKLEVLLRHEEDQLRMVLEPVPYAGNETTIATTSVLDADVKYTITARRRRYDLADPGPTNEAVNRFLRGIPTSHNVRVMVNAEMRYRQQPL